MRKASPDRQVTIALKILSTLNGQNMNANELVKHTSKDKTFTYTIIKGLRKEGLVASTKNPKYQQKRIQGLTDPGRKIAELAEGIEKFRSCRSAFRKARLARLPHKQIKHNDPMNPIIRDTSLLESSSFQYFFDLIFYKCAQISLSLGKKHALTRLILTHIITDVSKYYLDEITQVIDNQDPEFVQGLMIGGQNTRLEQMESLPLTCASALENPLIAEESNNLLSSIFSILRPSKNNIQKRIHKNQRDMERYLGIPEGKVRQFWINVLKRCDPGIAFYKQYLEKTLDLN